MVTEGTTIAANDYNTIQSLVTQVLGPNPGGGLYGYGQNVDSSQVSQNSKITVTQWRNLRSDVLRCRQHQTGTDLSAQLTYPTADVKIYATDREAYLSMMQTAALDANRLVAPPSSQATRENVVSNQTRTTAWNGSLSQTVTVTFPGYNLTSSTITPVEHARHYFNTGSRFEISASLTGGNSGTTGTKDYSWSVLLSGMGTVYFNRTDTTCTGSGTTTAIGWEDLTTTEQLIFQKDTTAGYVPNRYRIYARAPSSSQIVFRITWEDLSGQPNPPYGTDENVTGTLTSYVQVYRASGTNVTIPIPSGSTTSLA